MTRVVLASALCACACATTIPVQRPIESDRLAEINSILRDTDATIAHVATVNGHRHKDIASDIALTPEKVRWTVWESEFARERGAPPGRPVEAPIDAIRNVTVCQASCRGKGALEGAGFGLLAGVIVGALAETACHGELCGLWLVTGPILVVPVGALLGLAFGHRTIIEVEPVAKR